jgi:O-methyltransferase involved in polyketide biosynthesis
VAVNEDDVLSDIEDSLDKPSAARVYDYFIGGNTNYAIDREFGDRVIRLIPLIAEYAKTCRQFLGRAVRHCAEAGLHQFVDIGSGLPTAGNVHEVADEARPQHDTRVLYIDNEPIALAHSKRLLSDTADPERHYAMAGDLLDPEDLWDRVAGNGLIDLNEPIVLVLSAVLHFIKDEQNPDFVLDYYRSQLPSGSRLVLSQMTDENPVDEEERIALEKLYDYYARTTNPGQLRTAQEFIRFFGDWEMVKPGLVYAPAWHAGKDDLFVSAPSKSRILAGVARKA